MTIIHSSDLGWIAGQDISNEFEAVIQALRPGDVFVFDHMYVVDATNIQLADNITLAGGAPGAGLDVQGTKSHQRPLLELGNSNTLVDLTITHSDTTSADAFNNNGWTIEAYGDDIQILNCEISGYPREFVRSSGDNLTVANTSFDGAYYQMVWDGEATNFTVDNSLFQNSIGDGIKTSRNDSGLGTENATISNSVFMNNDRDGIDAVGGFKNSTITDSYFVNNAVSALDFKTLLAKPSDLDAGALSANITITNTEFTGDRTKFIVFTLLDRGDYITPENEDLFTPNNITVSNSTFENYNQEGKFLAPFLTKDAYDLRSTDNEFLGNIRMEFQEFDSFAEVSGTTTGPARSIQPDSYYQNLVGPDWSSISYPVDGTSMPVDPVVDPDPISYTPPDTTDPAPVEPVSVVDVPVEVSAPVTSASSFLDIFVAYTDTDETLSQLGNSSNIDSSLTDGRPLTIYATSRGDGAGIGSVKLTVDGVGSQVESVEPYALFGDSNGDFLGGKKLAEGSYTAELIVFSGKNGTGDVLETVAFDFTINDAASTPIVTPAEPVQAEPVAAAPVEPEPIVEAPTEPEPVAEAPVEPEPVIEAPVVEASVPTSAPVTSASSFLDIFVAYTDTDETLSQLGNSSNIDSSLTDGRPLTIYATSRGDGAGIGSVKLTVDGVGSQVESVEPYALFGDSNGDFLGGKKLAEGSYTAELIVFSGKNGTGDVLETVAFDFTINDAASTPIVTPAEPVQAEPVAAAPVEPEPETDLAPDVTSQGAYSRFLDIQLVDTGTDKVLGDLFEGAKLSSSDLSGRKITLSAEAINSSNVDIGSVKLEMDGQYSKIENVEPYALFGDRKGDFFGGEQLTDGTHFATLTVYSGKNGKGSILEQFTVNFEVGDYDSLIIDGSPSAISSYSASQDTGTATVSEDQSAVELKGSAWKSLNLFGSITENTVLEFDFKSDVEGEIHGIGFINAEGDLEARFFQLDGSQDLGIQDFNDAYETGSGFKSYTIPVGEYFTGSMEQLVLVSDDDADFGAMSMFSNIGLIEGIA